MSSPPSRGAEAQGLGAIGIDRRERRRVLLAVDQRQEDAAHQPRLVEEVLEHPEVEVDPEILPLPLEVGLVDGDRPRVGRAGLRRRVLLDLLGGVVREQQDQVVELVGERLEALVAAGGERELAPLVLGRRAQPVAPLPHEDRPHRAPVDRREEMERPESNWNRKASRSSTRPLTGTVRPSGRAARRAA